jgi:transmembrane sensor
MEIARELLVQYHGGRCTAEQKQAVEDWLNAQYLETDFPVGMGDGKMIENDIWNSMSENLGFAENERSDMPSHQHAENHRSNFHIPAWLLRIAASVLLLVVSGYVLWLLSNRHFADKSITKAETKSPATAYITMATKPGERKQYVLPDGSRVTLNANSEIRYPTSVVLTDTLRTVYLKGEAFFSVEKDPDRPFVVHTKRSLTRVLGTRFNLKAYERDQSVTLVVQEGKVRFSDAADKRRITLTANQRGILDHEELLTKDNVYANRYLAWKENRLVFENQPLWIVGTALEAWYGIDVVIENPHLKRNRYTGSFADKSVNEVLEAMSYAIGFKYEIRENKVIIY